MMCQVLNSAISHNTFYKSSCRADRLPIKNFNLTKYSSETQCKPNLKVGEGMDWLQSLGLHLSV